MHLFIVESPTKVKTISRYLGNEYSVVSSYGHLRALPSKNGSVKVDNDFEMVYEIIEKSKKHLDSLLKQIQEYKVIYLATDLDREGEAISWHLYEILKDIKHFIFKRVVFSEITKSAITKAIANSRDIDMNLVYAQQTRQALDYLVGFNISPILWRKLPGCRSAGRVQSVALKIICERESEIEKFIEQEYWTIAANFIGNDAQFIAELIVYMGEKLEKLSIPNEAAASDIVKNITKEDFYIDKMTHKEQKRNPPPPFTTSTMLQEASTKLSFSTKKTTKIAQELYEGVKIKDGMSGLITYMRTDSTSIASEAMTSIQKYITDKYGKEYHKARKYVNKSKNTQEAHEAIRPTRCDLDPENIKQWLTPDQIKLYEIIWKRTIASQMSEAIFEITDVRIASSNKTQFKYTTSQLCFKGFQLLYIDTCNKKDSKNQPAKIKKGERVSCKDITPKQHFTMPPPRFTEAALVKKMEELGIGRPSTYTNILNILQVRKYARLESRKFTPETKGRIVNAFLDKFFNKYVNYNFTAEIESNLDLIATAKVHYRNTLKDFWYPFKENVNEVMEYKIGKILSYIEKDLESFITSKLDNKFHDLKCPECKDSKLELKISKFGSFLGCSNYPDCKYLYSLEREDTNYKSVEDKEILNYPDGRVVYLKNGKYGLYFELKKEDKVLKRISIPKTFDLNLLEEGLIKTIIEFPKNIGKHPETGLDIELSLGKYGPYLKYDNSYTAIKNFSSMLDIKLEDAIKLINGKKKRTNKSY